MKAYLDSKQFFAPSIGNYVEVQIQFAGYSLNYEAADSGLVAEVGVFLDIYDGDSLLK